MIRITGGAYQGKYSYAINMLGINEKDIIDGAEWDMNGRVKCIKNYHVLVRRLMDSGTDVIGFTERFISENPDCIVIINEIGNGIVPIDRNERLWRENVGRAGCLIARNSERVIRCVSGIGIVIKGE